MKIETQIQQTRDNLAREMRFRRGNIRQYSESHPSSWAIDDPDTDADERALRGLKKQAKELRRVR